MVLPLTASIMLVMKLKTVLYPWTKLPEKWKKHISLSSFLESCMIQIQIQTLTNSNFDEKDP